MVAAKLADVHEHWLLAGVPREDLRPLLEAGREARYLPGEMIFNEGDPSDGLYLITAGSARVTATGGNGEVYLAVVKADEVLGDMGVLDGRPRSGTAVAVNMCSAFFLPAEPFLDFLERSTVVCIRLLVLLANRLRTANGRLGELPPTTVVSPDQTLPG